jgi:hypothetical protein
LRALGVLSDTEDLAPTEVESITPTVSDGLTYRVLDQVEITFFSKGGGARGTHKAWFLVTEDADEHSFEAL